MAAENKFRIGDISAEEGKKAQGFIAVGETPVGPIRIPIVIIAGAKSGPTLCLTAGVHATEYPAIDAVMRTSQSLDPGKLRGIVIAATVVNQAMFQTRTGFVSPIDGQNLNRMAPGRPDGTISEILAHTVLNELVMRADVHIDCHGGDLGEILWPYAGYPMTGDPERDRRGEAIARLYSPRIVALFEDGTSLPPTPGSITYAATRRGVVSVLAECGSNGTLEEADVQTHLNGIQNVLRYLGMIPGTAEIMGDRLRARGQFIVSATRGGLLRVKIGIGDEIVENQEIAEICDVFGDVVEQVRAPRSGIARLIWAHKAVNTGDPIVKCWITERASPFDFEGEVASIS